MADDAAILAAYHEQSRAYYAYRDIPDRRTAAQRKARREWVYLYREMQKMGGDAETIRRLLRAIPPKPQGRRRR